MGGNNTKALWLCEQIYPPDDKRSCIPPEKLQKAIEKGEIPAPTTGGDEDLDEDMDEILDKHIREVWTYYDTKGQEFLTKKQATKFFKDMLNLFALRRGVKPKDLLGPGVSMSSALTSSFQQLDKSNTGTITFAEFEEFVNMSDIEEALSLITGKTGPVEINVAAVQKVDPEAMAASAGGGKGPVQAGHIEYREYPSDEE